MIQLEHVSASSIQRFVECPANWLISYDQELRTSTRNERTDAGVLIHAALEMFRDPTNSHDQNSYEQLEACFEEVCRTHIYANSLAVYRRAKGLLSAAYRMGQSHPTVPIHLGQTIAVEQPLVEADGSNWIEPGWPLPVKGGIDRVSIIPLRDGYVLFIEDYKTGWAKTQDEVLHDHIQAPLYFLYARRRLVRFLEEQGIKILRIVGAWSFVAHGIGVPIYESDFDHEDTEKYVQNISTQMVALKDLYNKQTFKAESAREVWLKQYEKKNQWCAWCPRRNVCHTYKTMLRYGERIDLTDPNTSWLDIWNERETYSAIAKSAKARADEINDVIKLHIEQEGVDAIVLPEAGIEITAQRNQNKKWRIPELTDLFGQDFILRNADITEAAVKRELDRISKTDPSRARELEAMLPNTYVTVPGARPVRSRRMREEKPKAKARRKS